MISPERRHLALGVMLSLAIHALLLSLTFSGQGLGLPGFGFPWQDRRTEVPELRAVLLPVPVPAPDPGVEPLPGAGVEPPVAAEPTMMTLVDPAPRPRVTTAATAPTTKPKRVARPKTVAEAPAAPATAIVPARQPNESAPPPVLLPCGHRSHGAP